MNFFAAVNGFDIICEFFIKSSVILTLTFVLIYLFRKKSASIRHFLLSVSLICLLLIPIFSGLTKGWETGLLPTWQTVENRSQILQRLDLLGKSAIPLNTINLSPTNQQMPAQKSEENSRFNLFLSKYSISRGIFGFVLMTIWLAGLLILLSRILIGLYGAHKLTRQGKEISDSPWRQLLNHFLKAISIKRKINLFSHKNVSVPLTWGVFKPVVILPPESKNWSQDQRSSALVHELSHIKRGDFLVKILARCSIALYWFNPLSWFAFRMMKKEQEKACDELVLKTGVKPSTYAVNLLSIKKSGQFHWNPPTAALGAVGKSQLNERLNAILKQQLKPKEVNMKTKILLFSLIIMTVTFIGLARPSQSEALTIENEILSQEEAVLNNTQEVPQEVAVQEKQVKKTTKKTDKKESEDKAKKTITWVSDDGEKITFIISIDEEGETKISGIDTDMLIKIDKDSDGNTFTLHVDDKNLVLQKDEKGNWSLREDEGENLSYRLSTSHKQDKTYSIVYRKKGDKDDKNVFYIEAPKIHIEKLEKPKGAFNVHVSPKIVLPNKTFDIHIVGEEGEKKRIEFAPHMNVHMVPHVSAISLDHSDLDQKELKEKLEEITEKLKEIREKNELEMSKESKEEALKEVEEMLKKLSEELKEKKVELKDMALSIHTDAEAVHLEKSKNAVVKDILLNITGKLEKKKNEYVVVDIKESDDNKWVAKKDKVSDIDMLEGKKVTFVTTEGGEIQISMKAHFDSKSKAQYDEVIEKLKKDLPAGYTVESIIDEEAELITINIRGTQKDETAEITVKDILKKLEEQLSAIK